MNNLPWDQIPGSDKEEKMSYLYLHLGGLYHAVQELCKAGNFNGYCAELAAAYHKCLLASIREAAEAGASTDFKLILSQLQYCGSAGTDLNPFTQAIYDRGLLYIDAKRNLVPVSETAKRVIELVILGHVEPVEGGEVGQSQLTSYEVNLITFV